MGALRVKDFCREYGCSNTTAYSLIGAGNVEARKIGRRTVITRESAERWFASLPTVGAGDMAYGRYYGQGAKQLPGVNSADMQRSAA